MTIAIDDPRLVFIAKDKLIDPPDGLLQHIKDHWWIVHPEKGVTFWRPTKRDPLYPQCNSNQSLSEDIRKRMYPWANVEFIKSVFRPTSAREFE